MKDLSTVLSNSANETTLCLKKTTRCCTL